jgi:hypothetical protein
LIDIRRAAISHSACQNAASRDTLVACPAIRTGVLDQRRLHHVSRTMVKFRAFFKRLWVVPGQRPGNPQSPTGCLKERRQSGKDRLTGSHAGRHAGARNGSN